jgi:hypothetical protein
MSYGAHYGGFDPYGSSSQQQQSHSSQQQQQNSHQGPGYEGYDPSVPNNNNALSYAYNPSVTAPTAAFLPPFMPNTTMEAYSMSHSQEQQQKKSVYSMNHHSSSSSSLASATPIMAYSSIFDSPTLDPIGTLSITSSLQQADPAQPASDDSWLETIQLEVSGISLEPLSGTLVLQRVREKTDNVVTCYLPCVEFLVNCQQELRAGLAHATRKKLVRHAYRDNLTPRQFYNRYLAPLADRFHQRNQQLMQRDVLEKATQEVSSLIQEALKVQSQGPEAMKNAFLGGMKDGESWGLRKWLSKHGSALHICNDLECILNACQKLERGKETTVQLSQRLRPLAKQALTRLKNDVPPSYQQVSTAHPYLPFFHRLESALKGMANFDPEDDDVICIDDDDEIEQVKAKTPKKRAVTFDSPSTTLEPFAKRAKSNMTDTDYEPVQFGRDGTPPIKNPFDSDGDDDSVIEILGVKPAAGDLHGTVADGKDHWRCSRCSMLNVVCSNLCCMCSKTRQEEETCSTQEGDNDFFDTFKDLAGLASFEDAAESVAARIFDVPNHSSTQQTAASANTTTHASAPHAAAAAAPQQPYAAENTMSASEMIQHLERLAYLFDIGKQDVVRPASVENDGFWDSSGFLYARILRLAVSLIRNPECGPFLNAPDQNRWNSSGQLYSDLIKNPLCFRDIVYSLVDMDQAQGKSDGTQQPCGSGTLPGTGLIRWNMWRGYDLLQAIDLVFLNDLAFRGKDKTVARSQTNRIRKTLWDEIHRITAEQIGTHPGSEEERRRVTPTRRGETSGFVIRKV